MTAAGLMAAMARPGWESLAFWSRASRLLGAARCLAAYHEPQGGGWSLEHHVSTWSRRLEPAASLFAAAGAAGRGAVCAYTAALAKNGATVSVFAATRGPLAREAAVTAQAPPPSRVSPSAVLALLVRRLLEVYGVSYLRLAARLAKLGGGEAAVLILVHRRGYPAPLVYYASQTGPCVETAPGVAVAVYSGSCGPGGVVHARPQGGVVRVEHHSFREALRG